MLLYERYLQYIDLQQLMERNGQYSAAVSIQKSAFLGAIAVRRLDNVELETNRIGEDSRRVYSTDVTPCSRMLQKLYSL